MKHYATIYHPKNYFIKKKKKKLSYNEWTATLNTFLSVALNEFARHILKPQSSNKKK